MRFSLLLLITCMLMTPVSALGHRVDEPFVTPAAPSIPEERYETVTGIICRDLEAIKRIFGLLLEQSGAHTAIHSVNAHIRGADCRFVIGAKYTHVYVQEIVPLNDAIRIEYHRIDLRNGGLFFRFKSRHTLPVPTYHPPSE